MRLALYQPDIAPNVGAVLRLGACLGVPVDIIGPCGFALGDRDLRRVAMDYLELAEFVRHDSWEAYRERRGEGGRLVLLTTRAGLSHTGFSFAAGDTLLLGRESAGVPAAVHAAADACLRVPLVAGARSLNVAIAAAMVVGEALRQIDAYPSTEDDGPR